MKLKKLLAIGLVTVMSSTMLVGCGANSKSGAPKNAGKEKVFKITMVTDAGKVNDESFNQSAWSGLKNIEAEYGKDKVKVEYLESEQDANYISNIETLYDEGNDLIIGVGYKLADAIEETAKKYPKQQFVLIDAAYSKQPKNVTSLLFEDNVSAYLTGLIAGKMTETNKVGFIGGIKSDVIDKFEFGFRAGVETANSESEVFVEYTNNFTDTDSGKSIANTMYENGADIIFTAAGACGIGTIEAAKENNRKAIGVGQDQNKLAPENVITSSMKNIDVAVFDLVKTMIDGNYEGGKVIVNTLDMNRVGIAPTSDRNVPPDVLGYVQAQARKIKAGDIKVPQNEKEYKELKNNK